MSDFAFTPAVLKNIPSLVRAGYASFDIARILKCEHSTLLNICVKHGIPLKEAMQEVIPRPIPSEADPFKRATNVVGGCSKIEANVANAAISVLEIEADKRGTTPTRLAARILEIIASDNLFRAVLDN